MCRGISGLHHGWAPNHGTCTLHCGFKALLGEQSQEDFGLVWDTPLVSQTVDVSYASNILCMICVAMSLGS